MMRMLRSMRTPSTFHTGRRVVSTSDDRCPSLRTTTALVVALLLTLAPARPGAQGTLHAPFDKILDTYVRDGFVYYLALQKERGGLDRYLASLDVPRARVDGWPKADQEVFWINAYNATVLRTVIDAYPIKARSSDGASA